MAPAVIGSLVINQDITNVSAVPIMRHVIAFNADLCLDTFMMATPYC